jgi:hypothetical protein
MEQGHRLATLADGLKRIARSVAQLHDEIERCNDGGALRAGEVLGNLGREEAGKFLILIDSARDPRLKGGDLSNHFGRAGNHLAKLIYAQTADYALADRKELFGAVQSCRYSHHLDGPSDYDWIFRNELIAEREEAMYVDLIDNEGDLTWWGPSERFAHTPQKSLRLVVAIDQAGLTSVEGLRSLSASWDGFDHDANSHHTEWCERNQAAFASVSSNVETDRNAAAFAAWEWPMPLTRIDLSEIPVTTAGLQAKRQALFDAEMAREYGME